MKTHLVDAHTHLTFPQFEGDLDAVLARARDAGVSAVNSSVEPSEINTARELAKKDGVYWTLGLSASCLDDEKVSETLSAIREHKKDIIGIGEVGLDYYWVKEEQDHEKLRENFRGFIELSVELDLPLVVHSRDAEDDALALLAEYDKTALLHCFSGGVELATKAAQAGHMISIPTNITYVKSRQHLAKQLPLECIVLESDAPYLAPKPKTRNEPANVTLSAEKIAELKGVDLEEVAQATTKNAQEFYCLK